MERSDPVIVLDGVSKRYPNGTLANDGVTFAIREGTVHAIVGENGAGKSTVMKMLYGLERPTAGSIRIRGEPALFRSPQDAIAAGVGLVAQHLTAVPSFTVAENIALGREPVRGGRLDAQAAIRTALALSQTYGLAIDPTARLADLSVGIRQRVEILKTLNRGARLLLLDEPTAVLTPQETDGLFEAVRVLVRAGVSVVLITHKLNEVKAVSDHVTVMRAGRVVGQAPTRDLDERSIAAMMVGRALPDQVVRRVDARARPALVRVERLGFVSPAGQVQLRRVSFAIAPGEVLGVAGVEGNGQDELARVLSGVAAPTRGEATLGGAVFTGRGVRIARRLGVAAIAEDRLHSGGAARMSIEDNIVATRFRTPAFSRAGLLRPGSIRRAADRLIERFGVTAASSRAPLGSLSGGNMQKVVLGREVAGDPRLLIASQPTRGVDIAAACVLRDEIIALRDRGAAILLISADLDEVMALADRLIVLFQGEIVARLKADTADQREVGLYMMGLKRQADDDGVEAAA